VDGFDLARARADTPGCAQVAHFNNAGAALPPQPVLDAVIGHLQREAQIGGYEAEAEAAERLAAVYDELAALLGCDPDEVAVVENATRAWDMAFYALRFAPGDRILCARAEYESNVIAFLQVARRTGATVEYVPNDEHGQLSLDALRDAMDERVKLIAVTHVPSNGGLINPVEEIGAIARAAGVTYLVDGCQALGQLPIDVGRIGCDVFSATGRKYLRGPRATGLLYVRRELIADLEPPLLDLHAARWVADDRYEIRPDAKRFENWEQHVAGKLGLGAAARYAREWGLEAIAARVGALAARLREGLAGVEGANVHDLGLRKCGIVSLTVDGLTSAEVKQALAQRAINVSVNPGHYTLFDMQARGLPDLVRASVHYYNSEDEVDALVQAIAAIGRPRQPRARSTRR
jgi:cysteine desulfurase / selenocysteine lyase